MLYLRSKGVRTYDMGGIATGSASAAVSGINDFKIRFGGTSVREDHWLSPLYYLALLFGAAK
jgi:lipid II:glycine glycyltransferase (peptidoglycan interpeptide bridge formation enzyme)